jgi:4-oxalocrotonate tautomerase
MMPHVIVKMFPGRTDKQKKVLTEKIVQAVIETINVDEESISLAIEEIPRERWGKDVYKPDILDKEDTLYRNPGYTMPLD